MKKILSYIAKYLLPLVLGLGIFWLLYRQFDMKEILSILQMDMSVFWIVVSLLIGILSYLFRALRWQLQLKSLDITPSFGCLCNAVFGMYAFNLVLPRFGELWRCTYVAGHEKKSFSLVFGSAMSDRFADTLTVALLTVGVFCSQMGVMRRFLAEYPQAQERISAILTSPWIYAAIVAVVVAIVFLFARKSENRWINGIKDALHKMWDGFRSVVSMKEGKLMFVLYTVLIWGGYLMQLYVCFRAFDWMSGLSFSQALVLFVLGSISMVIPVQGGIGPWHAAIIFGLMFYGIGREQAGAFALVAHGSQMIVTILLGIYTTIAIMVERRRNKTIEAGDCSTE